MAKARMLHKAISLSKQVNSLPLPLQLLFTWLIAHADDDGKLKGDPEYIKFTVVPYKKWSIVKVKEYLESLRNAKLIYYWEEDSEVYIEFINWNSYQQIQKDRYHPSKLPSFNNRHVSKVDTERIQHKNTMDTESNVVKSNDSEIETKTNEIIGPFDNPFSD